MHVKVVYKIKPCIKKVKKNRYLTRKNSAGGDKREQ